MTNREKLNNTALYDLLMKLHQNAGEAGCIIELLEGALPFVSQLCESYGGCEECLQGYLNEEVNTLTTMDEAARKVDDEAYKRGLDEAWEAAEKVLMLESEELKEIFDVIYEEEVFGNFTPAKAIEKLRAYEEQKKAADDIKVGDEVERNGITEGVITRIRTDDDWVQVMQSNGSSYGIQKSNLKKTGRHFPQVEELLAALGGADDDTAPRS